MSQEQEISKLRDEINDLCDRVNERDVEIKRLGRLVDQVRDELSEKEDEMMVLSANQEDNGNRINTGRGDIFWGADNLLDQQLMEALSDLIGSKNNVALLQQLQEMTKSDSHAPAKCI